MFYSSSKVNPFDRQIIDYEVINLCSAIICRKMTTLTTGNVPGVVFSGFYGRINKTEKVFGKKKCLQHFPLHKKLIAIM